MKPDDKMPDILAITAAFIALFLAFYLGVIVWRTMQP